MSSKVTKTLCVLSAVVMGLTLALQRVSAQQPSPSPTKTVDVKPTTSTEAIGDDAGGYTINSSMEFGYRGLSVGGNFNKYQSDLNYKAGPRVFDSSFLMRAKEGQGVLFDTLLVTSSEWGADPYGNFRISAEKSKWYRFEGTYRRFKYFRVLNNFANPNFSTRPPDPVTGQHSSDTRQQLGDFDLTILPKNQRLKFNVGFSPSRYSGPVFTTWHYGGDDFMFLSQAKSSSNDFRIGADWKLGPVDFSFLQGFRRFKDDSFIDQTGINLGVNPVASNAFLTSIVRDEPVSGKVNYTRFSLHTFLARKVDITGRIIYSSSTTNVNWVESVTGINFNTRITNIAGAINPPNILTLGQFNFTGDAKRPNTLGDLGLTYFATDKLKLSNTFRVETFQINGGDLYRGVFSMTRSNGTGAITLLPEGTNYKLTKYRKLQNTVELDYQFNERYAAHFGYRYGTRRIEEFASGVNLANNGAPLVAPESFTEDNHTNVVFGGLKARPIKAWTIYVDAEHGTADNVFTRIGNYNYTNFRARSRYAPTRTLSFNFSVITRNNANPSEIGGVSLADFGVDIKSRVFSSSVNWTASPKLSLSAGYTHNWQNSDAVVDYYFNSVRHPEGHSLYFMRNHFFYLDAVAQLLPRVTLYAAYRINKDVGQGDRLTDPTGTPGFLITSYPMSYQSPEARLAIRLNRRLDWNFGYQYYNYRESPLVGPNNPQNYHAHLPYTSLRLYFGRGKG
ncbi:MAG: hypothetical protein QOJ64_849 [Acidobacteriota bacterium]|jgi:hypothetical protein|nr:hypothetical protein [Acidobacteriota bacterium]